MSALAVPTARQPGRRSTPPAPATTSRCGTSRPPRCPPRDRRPSKEIAPEAESSRPAAGPAKEPEHADADRVGRVLTAHHVVPLQDLVQQDPVDETAEAKPV